MDIAKAAFQGFFRNRPDPTAHKFNDPNRREVARHVQGGTTAYEIMLNSVNASIDETGKAPLNNHSRLMLEKNAKDTRNGDQTNTMAFARESAHWLADSGTAVSNGDCNRFGQALVGATLNLGASLIAAANEAREYKTGVPYRYGAGK